MGTSAVGEVVDAVVEPIAEAPARVWVTGSGFSGRDAGQRPRDAFRGPGKGWISRSRWRRRSGPGSRFGTQCGSRRRPAPRTVEFVDASDVVAERVQNHDGESVRRIT